MHIHGCTHLSFFFCVVCICAECTCVYSLASVMILLLLRLIYIANLPQGIIIIILLPKSQGKLDHMHYETSTASTQVFHMDAI